MKRRYRTIQFFAFSILILVVSAGAYVYMYKHMAEVRMELVDLLNEVAHAEALARNKEATVNLLNATEQNRAEIGKYLVSTKDPTEFLGLVESSAKDAGVFLEVESIRVDSTEPKEEVRGLSNMTVVFTTQGGWKETYHLLTLLEHLPYVTHIESANIKLDSGGNQGIWSGSFRLVCEGV